MNTQDNLEKLQNMLEKAMEKTFEEMGDAASELSFFCTIEELEALTQEAA